MKQLLNGIILAGIALILTGTVYQPDKTISVPSVSQHPAAVIGDVYDVPKPKPVVTQSVATNSTPKPTTTTTKSTSVAPKSNVAQSTTSYSGSHQDWMAAAGIAPRDYAAVDYIVSHESGWRYWVVNSEGSGATGLCQALPGSKMASAGADWATNPITQLKWCSSYATARYGGWWAAQAYWVLHHNW